MGDIISITLDPTKDGIVGKVDTMVATSGKYVVIGTNAEHRFISEKQFDAYTDELGKDDRLGLLIVKDFMIYYDKSKLIEVDDCKYLIRNNLSIKKYRFFLGLMCSFLLSELPVIYCYRDAEHTIQQDASHYIQALTFILIFGVISMIVVNVIQK